LACSAPNLPLSISYKDYPINSTLKPDTSLINLIQPYGVELNKTMGKVIGFANTSMYKKQPESILGNFMADCIQKMGAQKFNRSVDIGFMNQGGIRAGLNKGNITVGNVYELMPFDNLIVIQELSGTVLEKFIQLIAADGGWPISAGSSFTIKDKKAIDIIINGKPIDLKAKYITSNSDYIANGGSNSVMLKGIPYINKGYLLRDALVDYINDLTKAGKPVDGKLEKRVSVNNE
jgi:2',3'-cyclic-nucleotide 2'-phosphodiesterase (5'-nucleotidase family)